MICDEKELNILYLTARALDTASLLHSIYKSQLKGLFATQVLSPKGGIGRCDYFISLLN